MLVYISDHESVTCLILGLAARLAKAEQNSAGSEVSEGPFHRIRLRNDGHEKLAEKDW